MEQHGGNRVSRVGGWQWLVLAALVATAGPAFAAEDGTQSKEAVPAYISQLVALACGPADGDASARKCHQMLLAKDAAGNHLRQLAGHYLVTAFTELGAARMEDDGSRGNVAPYILQRAQVAELELHEACRASADSGVAGAVAYPLERADALVAVADAIEAGTRPSRRRLLALLMNPQAALERAADIFKDAIGDKLYSDAYRQSFHVALDRIVVSGTLNATAWGVAWRTLDKRLNAQCRSLARISGARVEEDDNPCAVATKHRCASVGTD